MPLIIEYRLVGTGWAECKVRYGEAECQVSASYLSDALGRLVVAAAALLAGAHSVSVGFDEEPGEYRWAIDHSGNSELQVRLLEFEELWSNLPNSDGKVLLQFLVHPLEFGEAVSLAASSVLAQHGAAEYKEMWVRHEFPHQELALLNQYIAQWRQNAG